MDDDTRWYIKILFIVTSLSSVIPAVALGIGTDDDDDAGGYAVNNTTFVEYETGAFGKVLHHFYDEECLAEDPELYKRTAEVSGEEGAVSGDGNMLLLPFTCAWVCILLRASGRRAREGWYGGPPCGLKPRCCNDAVCAGGAGAGPDCSLSPVSSISSVGRCCSSLSRR